MGRPQRAALDPRDVTTRGGLAITPERRAIAFLRDHGLPPYERPAEPAADLRVLLAGRRESARG